VGTEGESEFWGQSFVADYYGQIVAKAPVSDEAILYADLDLDALEDHRRIWPFFRDRRIDSYGGITERWGRGNFPPCPVYVFRGTIGAAVGAGPGSSP